MKYLESIKFPNDSEINNYFVGHSASYPWNLFFENRFEWLLLKDITILYGNNGSGKSTTLNLIAEKIHAKRSTELYKDVVFDDLGGKYIPFDDFLDKTIVKFSVDDFGKTCNIPENCRLITSTDIFDSIKDRIISNNRTNIEIEKARKEHDEILKKGYSFKGMEDYDNLVKLLSARKLSKTKYVESYSKKKRNMQSNGETAISVFENTFKEGGIYLLDEPENCLSPIFQIELAKLIFDSSKYFNCQFIICTHSPIFLSLENALVYDLDSVPVEEKKWYELENVKLFNAFFNKYKKYFEK